MADLTYAQARALIQSDPLTAFAMLLSGNQPDGTAIDTVLPQPTGGTLVSGTKSLTTTAALALSAGQACSGCYVQNDPSNLVNVAIGSASGQSCVLLPGDWSPWLPVSNVSQVYGKNASSTTQTVNWLAV
jgi:hypothetical protein